MSKMFFYDIQVFICIHNIKVETSLRIDKVRQDVGLRIQQQKHTDFHNFILNFSTTALHVQLNVLL